MYLSAKNREEERLAILEKQRLLDEALKKDTDDFITDQEMVDRIFGFLPIAVAGQEVRQPKVLHIL